MARGGFHNSRKLKTFEEQKKSHIEFLQSRNLAVSELEIDQGFIRCKLIEGEEEPFRGEYAYKTWISELQKKVLRSRNLVQNPGRN